MKKLTFTLLAVGAVASAFAQGTVNFTTVSGSNFRSPVYAPSADNSVKTGNNATGIPVGTQVYTGPLLSGSGFTAQLWAAPGSGAAEGTLQAGVGAITTFRTGSAAGFVTAITGTLTGVAKDAPSATLQLRVWDNMGGTVTSWAAAQTQSTAFGKSALFNVNAIGGDVNAPPFLSTAGVGIESFNLQAVPEPSTFVLAGLGAAGLLIFRRRK